MTVLIGRRIIVVEDNYLVAMEVKATLEKAGAEVVGPFPTAVAAQLSMLQRLPDCAALDVNLGPGASFDLARLLRMREVPFVFFTGYDAATMPAEFGDVECLEKPVDATRLTQAVERCCRGGRRRA